LKPTVPPGYLLFRRMSPLITTEPELAAVAAALGAAQSPSLTTAERALIANPVPVPAAVVASMREQIAAGNDPLGDVFCTLRSSVERRPSGATYTPLQIVRSMLAWAATQGPPDRVVDAGAGSGRFIVNAGRSFPKARLIAIELDPLAALLTRGHLAAAGLSDRADVIVSDYRAVDLRGFIGRTLYTGNPPYVRHHLLQQTWKDWLTRTAEAQGLTASQLAGLHVHFFLATVEHAYVTAAEWLDVNYGQLVRKLFTGPLGGSGLHIVEPTAAPFPDATTTAAITCFHIGRQPDPIIVRRAATLDELGALDGGHRVKRERLEAADRWTPLTHRSRKTPEGYVQLGELCRVSRGQVTGANDFWIADDDTNLPASVLYPTVTRARELLRAGRFLSDPSQLRRVIDLPEDLSQFTGEDRRRIDALLRKARAAQIHKGYVASHRRAWWSVSLYEPAPILATYMARRAPGFVCNLTKARHINIAHGIYPRVQLTDGQITALADHLATHTSVIDGRTYAGGLTKFEPKEMERLLVPTPEMLA
jgi:adenine-specific DNA-methyltransferase